MSPMEQSVDQALAPYATPTFIDNLCLAVHAMQEHQYADYELELTNILETDTGVTLLQRAHDCLYSHLNNICVMHRLTVSTEADIVGLAKLVRALLTMQFWEDGDSIVALCDSDASDEDILVAIVVMVGELTEHEASLIIEEIDHNFLRGLKALYTTDAISTEDPSDFQVGAEQLHKLRTYRTVMHAEKTLAYRMVKAGYQPGAAVEQYLKRVTNALSERENKDIATEVVPFLLMGRDSWSAPLMAWRENNYLLNLEPQDITAIDAEIIKLLGEYDRLSTNTATIAQGTTA